MASEPLFTTKEMRRLRNEIEYKNLGLDAAIAHLQDLRMDTEDDEAVRLKVLDFVWRVRRGPKHDA